MTESTNPWLQFLSQHGARISESGDVLHFGEQPAPTQPASFVAPLTHLGLIEASGDDAANFLHGQLSSDMLKLGANRAVLAAYCSPKGRMLASFLVCRDGDAILLQLPADTQATVQKRLQMFVMRAKAKLNDASQQRVALGIVGDAAAQALAGFIGQALPTIPFEVTVSSNTSSAVADAASETAAKISSSLLIRMPDADGRSRYQWIVDPETAMRAWPVLVAASAAAGAANWRLTEIHAALPAVVQATQEKFVPQMINFELIGGVNFRKGCYPGQEIVARSQYLGKLKRRMLLARIASAEVSAGMEVFSSTDPEQPCGQIVNAELAAAGHSDCLVELKTAMLEQGTIHLGSAHGAQLDMLPLPYPLTDPE